MNLIDAPWIPVRRADGTQDWVSPLVIGDPDIVALDASRADFNGALAQFLIGLLQTTTPIDSLSEWRDYLDSPPDATSLEGWFAPVREAFMLDGDGPRFMQDHTLPADAEAKPIAALLLESPGEQSLKFNTDHFIKRDTISAACADCATHALLTLQLNAPAGGAGHRTSLRGGGPLTTLVISASETGRTLWRDLWLNARERSVFLAQCGDPEKTDPQYSFPWLADIAQLQKEKGDFSPLQGHPSHVFWAMPRRIRLDFDTVHVAACDLCGRHSDRLLARYTTKNYGLNYKGSWNHPFSPYYENKPEEWLPVHPQLGGYGYRHWLPWVLGASRQGRSQRPASVVTSFLTHHHHTGQFRLWAFGYDMNNMKACCWYESTLPIYGLAESDLRSQEFVQAVVGQLVEGANLVALYVHDSVKQAWFGVGTELRGDLSFVDVSFYADTESEFYELLKRLIGSAREGREDHDLFQLREQWRQHLIAAARRLFDDRLVGASPIQQQNPRRVAEAHKALMRKLYGNKLRQALGLTVAEADSARNSSKGKRKIQGAS